MKKSNHRLLAQIAMREAYWAHTPEDSGDLSPLFDRVNSLINDEGRATAGQAKALLMLIPDTLFGSAVSWGFSDSVVRDNLGEFIEKNRHLVLAAIGVDGFSREVTAEKIECWSCKKTLTLEQRADADGFCPHCSAEIEDEDED